MRNTYFIAGLALGSYLLSGVAFAADSAQETYDVEATVGQTTTITNIAGTADNGLVFNAGTQTFTVDTASFESGDATIVNGTNMSSTIGFDVMSNYAHNVSLKSTNDGMVVDAPDKISVVNGTFLEVLDYGVTVIAVPVILTLNTGSEATPGRTVTQSVAGAMKAAYVVAVSVNNTPDGVPIVAGTYKDTLTLKVGATF